MKHCSRHFSPNSLLLGVLNALKNGRLGAGWSGRVPGRLVSHFLSFVSQFFTFVSQVFICFPVLFICLPGWALVVGFPAGLSPTSFHMSPSSIIVCQFFSLWSGSRLACLPLPFIFVSQDSQAGCLRSGSQLACLPLPCICLPFPFICLPLLFICLPGWVLVVGFPAGLSPTPCICLPFFPKQFTVRGSQFFLKMCPPFVSLLVSAHFHWPCSISIHLSCRSVTAGVRPFPLVSIHSCVSQVCHWWCPPLSAGHVTVLFICFPSLSLLVMCLPGLSLAASALFRWPCNISIHVSPRSVTAGVRPFPLAMQPPATAESMEYTIQSQARTAPRHSVHLNPPIGHPLLRHCAAITLTYMPPTSIVLPFWNSQLIEIYDQVRQTCLFEPDEPGWS